MFRVLICFNMLSKVSLCGLASWEGVGGGGGEDGEGGGRWEGGMDGDTIP